MPDPTIKVTRIGSRWHIRIFRPTGEVHDEMACETRLDIGWCCRYLMRWYDKCGGMSTHASKARYRHSEDGLPAGKIWYPAQVYASQLERAERRKVNSPVPSYY